MILIFDLDDTLYDELTYVYSGLRSVARFGEQEWGWDFTDSQLFLRNTLLQEGRGKVFDSWLVAHGKWSRSRVAECVRIYRHHSPNLSLYSAAHKILGQYNARAPLYLVTDGHKVVQENKIEALNLQAIFCRIFITHRYGLSAAKPSTHCFEIIRNLEKCGWNQLVYVGDDPTKDFVGLNRFGVLTVRVLTGKHRNLAAKKEYDASLTIPNLHALPSALSSRFLDSH